MENKKRNKGLYIILLIGLIGLLFSMFFLNFNYIDSLEKQVSERDSIIKRMSFRNALVEKYFDIEYDSISNETLYKLKNPQAKTIIRSEKEIIQQKEIVHYKGDKEITSDQLVNEYNKMLKQYSNLEDDYEVKKIALELIEKAYSISYIQIPDSNCIRLVNTNRVDSALMLLPYYRSKLESIDGKKWKVIIEQ